MSKCNQCPYNCYDYEGNYTDCSLYDVRNPSLILWNENKCRCRIPLFVLKIMHKRDMKAEDKYWGDLSEESEQLKQQIEKAKEIIKDYMTIAKGAHTAVCGVSEENRTINVLKLNEEAEQFLKESN